MTHKVGEIGDRNTRVAEITTVVVFLVITFIFAAFHKFQTVVKLETVKADEIEIERVEVTEQVKKSVRPSIVRIPIAVEDEEEIEEDVELEIETADFDISSEPPPPPPPPAVDEEEVFEFFSIQEKPVLVKETASRLKDYIIKNYPPLARKSGVSGKVIVRFVCSKEGVPTNLSVVFEKPKDMGFGEVAIKAVQQLRFTPGMQRDKPVPVRMSQKIDFKTSMR